MSPRVETHLVELEAVQQIVELSVLLALGELDKVLLKTVEGQLGLVVDVNLERLHVDVQESDDGLLRINFVTTMAHVLHELFAGDSDFLSEGSAEHHDLLVSGRRSEDLLDVSSHV